ncbi:hypothetical protein [Acinetobacter bereziniae]|uniref:hypothetical protein n=1 Tax=Acinetobacter bereziniae TaxID=106648 RepID=UPI0032157416
MYQVDISFNNKEWLCKKCGLLKPSSKIKLKIGDEVFFLVSKKRNESETISKEVNGTILDINNNQLIILDKKEIKTYFINKNEAFLKGKPAFFLYNMYGECMCRNE